MRSSCSPINSVILSIATLVYALVLTFPVFASSSAILPAPRKFSEHVYVWIGPYDSPDKNNQGFRMNLAFVVGKQSVAVLDSGYTEAMAREMIAHIHSITLLPIRYMINTNSQPHRYSGNVVFTKQGAKTFAHPLRSNVCINVAVTLPRAQSAPWD